MNEHRVVWGVGVGVGPIRIFGGVTHSPSPHRAIKQPLGRPVVTLRGRDVSRWVVLFLAGCPGWSGGGRAGSRSGKVALASEEVDPPPLPRAWDENSVFLFTLPGP